MEIGIDSTAFLTRPRAGEEKLDGAGSLNLLLDRMQFADEAGLDVFGIGEHHRPAFLNSSPAIILAAAATRTQRIRLTSSVTVLSAVDPVRAFQNFATLDLISRGRAEMVVGRGSFVDAFPLFGHSLEDYDSLFRENLDLLLTLREDEHVQWTGKHRAPLTGQGVYPRPLQKKLPVWLGVGGTPQSFARAGALGLPLMVAIIGGHPLRFRPLIDLYRQSGRQAGHASQTLKVGVHTIGHIAETSQQAADEFYPGYAEIRNEVGRERGWPPISRAQYDAELGPAGAMLIGSPEQVADKIALYDDVLGGIVRITVQAGNSDLSHENQIRSIELLAQQVRPMLAKETHVAF
jgi:probable LLM family oxidoreductase